MCLCILFFSYDHEINITAQKNFPCCLCSLFNLGVCLRVILTKLSDFVDCAEFINVGTLMLLYND